RDLIAKAQDKAVVVEVDRDLVTTPDDACFERIDITGPRTMEITYRKDRVNAGQVLDALQKVGLGIIDVSTRDPDLEDVFLSLTREAAT
ncbi:MAG TPA: ABC transporter ATP-binding protein, partial [Sphingomicrobium sp.]|nr:ABC transporter ATP-binding protein [Sphingomicrobium sp.]